MRRAPFLAAAAAAALILPGTAHAQPAPETTGATYYLDAQAGDDAADGRSAEHPWRSLAKVAATTFQPGDTLLLHAGQAWTGQLWPKGSGGAGLPITIDRYGDGAKPGIAGAGATGDAVRLFNQQYWTIRNLDVSNAAPASDTPGANLKDLRGVHVGGDNGTTLHGFVLDAVDVHDVTGEVNWISGSAADDTEPGIHHDTGWDRSKRTGGIVFDATVADIAAPPATPTLLDGVTIEHSTVTNTSFAGIVIKQYTGDAPGARATGWGSRDSAADTKFAPHTNVVIRDNFISQAGTAYGCNGMYVTNVRGALIEHNTVFKAGTSGIEMYFADDVTTQYNEVYETSVKAGGADSNGIDPDKGTTRQLVQYNFVHHNGDGILLCQFAFGDAIVRGNVVVDNRRYQLYLHSDKAARANVHNNTFYSDRSDYVVYGYGSSLAATYDLTDNVFATSRAVAVLTTSPTIRYDANLYGSAAFDVPDTDTHAVLGDPRFDNPAVAGPFGTAATGPQLATGNAFRAGAASPAIDGGMSIVDNGGHDYAGTALYNGGADIGAFEYSTPTGATAETVAGTVRTPAGAPIAGATVHIGSSSATTGADGWYAIGGVPFGDVTVTASRNGYQTATQTVTVRAGNRSTVPLTLASTSTVGSVTGTVLDQAGRPLAGVTLTVRDGDQAIATGTSSGDGTFTVAAVPVGEGYTLVAATPGLDPATRTGLEVTPATATAAGTLLLAAPVPQYLDVQTFDAMPPELAVSAQGGSVGVSGGALNMTRTANSGRTSVQRTFSPALQGLVTVEAKVMRDDPYTSGNNYFGTPYLRGPSDVDAVSVAFTKNTIIAYSGTTSVTLGAYQLGRWYTVRTVVDIPNQRFDLYIDGEAKLTGAAFRAPMAGVQEIEFFANSSNYGGIHVDDFRVAQGIGSRPNDTGLLSVTTDQGTPAVHADGTYTLDVPATTRTVTVTAAARSRFAQTTGSGTITLGDTGADVPITVTAEDGTREVYQLQIRKPSLDADASLSGLTVTGGDLEPAFSPDVYRYELTIPASTTSVQVTPAAANPRSTVTVAGDSAPRTVAVPPGTTDIPVVVGSADGTASSTYTIAITRPGPPLPPDGAAVAPATGVLSSTSGWATGLHDGNFDVVMNLWWGSNGSVFTLYENGVLIDTVPLTAASPAAQRASVPIAGRRNGTYVYTGELLNQAGRTALTPVTVTVTDAAPGVAVVSSDNWDGDGSYTVSTNLWWGTNGSLFTLYENGVPIDRVALTAATPAAQHVSTVVAGRAPGTYSYVAELSNAAGATRSVPVTVVVAG
ncbi:carboxypeptidase regulatory-like domain-containing protein [Dactylosporangium sp. NPDC049140]|uniref:carboxypeptidase regulatory-like domain-containing protein n=1 Tax=Dactylosporangium sp. NPDC049140 TaxID=3155647 RepID=UPI0033C70743